MTTQPTGLVLRWDSHPLGKRCYGLQLLEFCPGMTPPPRYPALSATLSSSADFPGYRLHGYTLLRRFRGGTRRASPVAAPRVLVTVPSLPPRRTLIVSAADMARCSPPPSRGQDTLGLRTLAF